MSKFLKGFFIASVYFMSPITADVQEGSLLAFSNNVTSDAGEDGILREIFKRMKISRGLFVDLGSGNGMEHSMTRSLYEKGWTGVLVETRPAKYIELMINYTDCANAFIFPDKIKYIGKDDLGKDFDDFADEHFSEKQIDLLVLNGYGLAYKVLMNLERRPRVIAMKHGKYWHPHFNKMVPENIAIEGLQQPLNVLIQIASSKGYSPICCKDTVFFVRKAYARLFPNIDRSAVALWKDSWESMNDDERKKVTDKRLSSRSIRHQEGSEYTNLYF